MYHSKKDYLTAFLFVIPSIIAVLIFVYGFIIWSIRVSFTSWERIIPKFDFVGFKNYISIFTSSRFQIDLWNTFFFTVFFLMLSILIGLILAILLDKNIFFQQRMVTIFGLERMQEFMASDEPFIMPIIHYKHSFDVFLFILT